MKFLIDTFRTNETIAIDLTNVDEMSSSSELNDVIYIDGEPCILSTARSLESEAVKEATALIQRGVELLHDADKLREWAGVREWLEKWDTK